jgi:hypothetical protein
MKALARLTSPVSVILVRRQLVHERVTHEPIGASNRRSFSTRKPEVLIRSMKVHHAAHADVGPAGCVTLAGPVRRPVVPWAFQSTPDAGKIFAGWNDHRSTWLSQGVDAPANENTSSPERSSEGILFIRRIISLPEESDMT